MCKRCGKPEVPGICDSMASFTSSARKSIIRQRPQPISLPPIKYRANPATTVRPISPFFSDKFTASQNYQVNVRSIRDLTQFSQLITQWRSSLDRSHVAETSYYIVLNDVPIIWKGNKQRRHFLLIFDLSWRKSAKFGATNQIVRVT